MNTRREALRILYRHTPPASLRCHALPVESGVAAYARHLAADEETWRITALLHDFNYEMHSEALDHPMKGEPILSGYGISPEIRRALLSHANYSGITGDSPPGTALFACDELSGFISACALVKPSRKVAEVAVKTVPKKMKDRAFACSVSREDIIQGAALMGLDPNEHIAFCITAMQANARAIGL